MNVIPLRFSDVRLGQDVALDASPADNDPMKYSPCEMVRRWSGASAASLIWRDGEHENFVPEQIAGRIFARHLDGSNLADVEVVMRGSDICAKAVVRVALG